MQEMVCSAVACEDLRVLRQAGHGKEVVGPIPGSLVKILADRHQGF